MIQPLANRHINRGGVIFAAIFAFLPCGLRADHRDFIVISATASKDYTQRKFVNGVARPESYAFFEGKYFGGGTRDPSIAHATFMDIAKVLVPNLAKQNYLPAKDPKAADLLIVVNWGTTITDYVSKTDPETQFQLQQELADVKAYNAAAGGITTGGSASVNSALAAASEVNNDMALDGTDALSANAFAHANADLLGYNHTLNKEMATASISYNGLNAEAESHMADLFEERYFILILAYDYQKMLTTAKGDDAWLNTPGTAKSRGQPARIMVPSPQTQPVPIWEVRMNIRATGNNFMEALPAMSKVAADYFGKQLDDLKTEETNVGIGRVEIGPVEVIKTDNLSQK